MNRKKLVIITTLILICIIGAYFIFNNNILNDNFDDNNDGNIDFGNERINIRSTNETVDLKGEKTKINGLYTMIPDRYSNGTIKTSSGIETYGKYDDDSIYVTVYTDSADGNKVYQGDIDYFAYGIANQDNDPKRTKITLFNNEILYVIQHSDTRGDYRLAFFKVNDKKVFIEWLGTEIAPDIKNIIYGFYKLN
jgi:hypothetical protein